MDNKLEINRSTIRITNLALRTIIGFNDWERREHQDVIINICAPPRHDTRVPHEN